MVSRQPLRLDGLSHDILQSILDHLDHRKAWLRSMALVSRQLYETVLPRLYHELDFEVYFSAMGHELDYKILQMLDKTNRGLQHIRSLILTDHNEHICYAKMRDYPEAALLIHLLPKNTLKSFEWSSWHRMSCKNYQALLSRQRSLTSLELNCSNIPIDEMVGPLSSSACLLHGFEGIEELRIMPGRVEKMPQMACDFFKKHDTIRVLRLDLMHMASESDSEVEEHLTSSAGVRSLFGSLEPSSVRLHTLDLTGVNFQSCHGELLSALELSALSSLFIAKCQYPEEFLTALTEKAKRSPITLKVLIIYHSKRFDPVPEDAADDGNIEPDPFSLAIGLLLASLKGGLREVCIYLRGFDTGPSIYSLINHATSLRWLCVDVREQKGPSRLIRYGLQEWQWVCTSLVNLQQLDMIFPDVTADCHISLYEEFCAYVEATASIKTLTSLGMNNWPQLAPGPSDYDPNSPKNYVYMNQDLYRLSLSVLATQMWNLRHWPGQGVVSPTETWKRMGRHIGSPSLRTPKASNSGENLRLISFGLREEITSNIKLGFGMTPMCFVKSRIHVMGGEKKWHMEPVTNESLDWKLFKERMAYDIDALAHDVEKFEDW